MIEKIKLVCDHCKRWVVGEIDLIDFKPDSEITLSISFRCGNKRCKRFQKQYFTIAPKETCAETNKNVAQ